MDTVTFRRTVGALAQHNGFAKAKSRWFRVSPETTIALELQRSGYGMKYYLNVMVWIQGFGNRAYDLNELSTNAGHLFRREPPEFSDVLDLETSLHDATRQGKLETLSSLRQPDC